MYYLRMWGQLSTTCCNATEVPQWGASSCSRPQPAMENGVRDCRSNWLAITPTLQRAVSPELHLLHGANAVYKSQDLLQHEPASCVHGYARPTHCRCSQAVNNWENARRWQTHAHSYAWHHSDQSANLTVNKPRIKQWFLILVRFFCYRLLCIVVSVVIVFLYVLSAKKKTHMSLGKTI